MTLRNTLRIPLTSHRQRVLPQVLLRRSTSLSPRRTPNRRLSLSPVRSLVIILVPFPRNLRLALSRSPVPPRIRKLLCETFDFVSFSVSFFFPPVWLCLVSRYNQSGPHGMCGLAGAGDRSLVKAYLCLSFSMLIVFFFFFFPLFCYIGLSISSFLTFWSRIEILCV